MKVWPGQPYPLGAMYDGSGTNFSLFSEIAERVELCLFDAAGDETRIDLPEVTGYCWHGYLPTVEPGQRYGFRVHGPWDPANGQRCNPAKLLLDPYALDPERSGKERDHQPGVTRTADGRWTAPFMMSIINARVVLRSNALLGYPYGTDFRYTERMRFRAGPQGLLRATGFTAGLGALTAALAFKPTRVLLDRALPSPGLKR